MPIDGSGPSPNSSPTRFLISRLESLARLRPDEASAIEALCTRQREHSSGSPLTGSRRPYAHFVVSGWIGRARSLADGRRQIMTTALPGEFIGRHPNPMIDATIIALTNAITLDLGALLELLEREPGKYPNISLALAQVQQMEEAQMADQVFRLGKRNAAERLSHWLLEVHGRLSKAGLVKLDCLPMPLSQDLMADVLGLSVVHVNRTVQQLRRAGLIEVLRGSVTLRQMRKLRAMTEFDEDDWSMDAEPMPRAARGASAGYGARA